METISIIAALISIVALVCFFILVSDVGKIKNYLETSGKKSENVYLDEFRKHQFWRNDQKATELLKDAFWYEASKIKYSVHPESVKLKMYDDLKNRFSKPLSRYQIIPPDINPKE
ncbi:hypothetical protein BDE36_3069 [Arcticibacter tournemirensis]|uniref:Uncharacterized protein n=1 Tax=Arcticibacter tournemirensis TaxID=699437 RepID=A0A5M9GTH2_9SPHI|nr:hypothetical protein [Arcticibacter tournemirensis]KAA8476104.1 hypothetical protein F1649_20530 [Arcticibacter tournemirensis]TQM51293.1 hypothetical protein BDE36_3069 [Arcticibacter tournemirensis]